MNEPTRVEAALAHIRETLHIGLQDATLTGEAGRERIAAWADFVDCEIRSAVTASEPPRPPAESSPEPPTGPERGTGEAGPETSTQAVEGLANEFSPTLAEIAAWADSARREIDTAHFDVKTAIDRIANVMRPIHLHEASASIHTIADHMPGRHPEFVRGVRYAANLLGHTADDLTEGATP